MPTDLFRDCCCGATKCTLVCCPIDKVDPKDHEENTLGQLAGFLETKDVAGFSKIIENQPPHLADQILEAPSDALPITIEKNSFPDSTGWLWTCGKDPKSPGWRRFWIAMWWGWMVMAPLGVLVWLVYVHFACASYTTPWFPDTDSLFAFRATERASLPSPCYSTYWSRSDGSGGREYQGYYHDAYAISLVPIPATILFFNVLSRFPICGVHYFWICFKWPAKTLVAVDLSNITISRHATDDAGTSTRRFPRADGDAPPAWQPPPGFDGVGTPTSSAGRSAAAAGGKGDSLLGRGKRLVATLYDDAAKIVEDAKKEAGLIRETAKALDRLLDSGNDRRKESMAERGVDKAEALELANAIVQHDAIKYRMAFKKVLDANGGAARAQRDHFDSAAAGIASSAAAELAKYPNGKIMQPGIGGVDPVKQKGKYVIQSNKKFKAAMPPVLAKLEAIAAGAGGQVHEGPVKATERLLEKARLSYGGNLQRVTDFIRLSIVCTTFPQLQKVLQGINMDFTIVRIKNRFAMENQAAKDTAAYRDCQLNLLIPGTKMVIEVQLHLDVIYELKSKVAAAVDADGRTGHHRYIEFRLLKETADHEFGDVE